MVKTLRHPDDASERDVDELCARASACEAAGELDEAERLCLAINQHRSDCGESWRVLAKIARRRGDRPAALKLFQAAREADLHNPWIAVDLGEELRDLGRFDEAEALFAELTQAQPDFVHGWRGRALIALRRGDRAAAIPHFEAVYRLTPEHPVFALEFAEALLTDGRFDEAELVLAKLAERDPAAAVWRGLGMAARARGDRDAALRHFLEARRLAPTDPWIAVDLGETLRDLGRLDDAEHVFSELTAADPGFVHGWRGLALIAERRGDRAAAIPHFAAAARCAPDHAAFVFEFGNALREEGRLDEAEAVFQDLTSRHSGHSPGWRGLGMIARQRGAREAASRFFAAAHQFSPDDPWIAFDHGDQLRELGRLDEAEAVFLRLTQGQPDFLHGWRGLAALCAQRGADEEAIGHFRAALRLAPDNAGLRHEFGHVLRACGRFDEAETVFGDLAERDERDASACRGLGLVARQRGDRLAALGYFEAARGRDPNDPWIIVDLGDELRELGRLDEAEALLLDLTATRPDFIHGWRGRAAIVGRRGDFAAAVDLWRMARSIAPDDPLIALECGHGLREAERFAEAEVAFRELAGLRPNWSAPWRGLGLVARQRGDRVAAREFFVQARAAEPDDAWAAVDLGYECQELGAAAQAEACFAELTARKPNFAHGWRGLGVMAREAGRFDEALAHFRRAAALEPAALEHKFDVIGALRSLGQRELALAEAEILAQAEPDSAMASIVLAGLLQGERPHEQVIALYRRAVELEPMLGHIRAVLANACLDAGRFDEAEAIFDEMLARSPGDIGALVGASRILRRRGDKAGAIERLRRAFAQNSSHEGVAQELALELAANGRPGEAEQVLVEASALRENSPSLENCRGHLARMRGDFVAAREHFAAVVAQAPDVPAAQVELAEEDFRQGQVEAAIERLRLLHLAQPQYPPALERLADFCSRLDDLDGAIALRRRLAAIDAGNYRHWLEIARIELALGKTAAALETATAAERRFGLNPDTALRRSEILNHGGDHGRALEVIRAARQRWPGDFEIAMRLAWMAIEAGEFVEAERLLTGFGPLGPYDAGRVAAQLGQLRAAQWRPDEARACFLRAVELDPANGPNYEWVARMALALADVGAAEHYLKLSKVKDCIHLVRHGGLAKPSQSHVGQLLDEYRIDVEALGVMRAAQTSADPVDALAEMLRDFPDYTPAAMAFLVALRRRGDFSRPAGAGVSPIPRRIFQYWDKDIPDDVAALCDSWRAQNPDFSYRRFSLAEARVYLQQIAPAARLAFDRAKEPAMKADLFRLAVLWREGGFYADADDRCVAGLERLAPPGVELALYQEDYGTVGNNFIGAAPGHPAIRAALETAVGAINRGDADIVWLATGPGLLTRCVAAFLAEDVAERLAKICVHERHDLRRAVAQHCPASYKHTSRHWSRSSFNASSAYRRSLQALSAIVVAERAAFGAPKFD